MSNQAIFNQAKEEHLERLQQYVPIVARVHGGTHPEFLEVYRIFKTVNEKISEAGSNKPELDEEFVSLRIITDNYTVPGDVCESYEAVYNMLGEIDKAYHI